MKTLVIGASTNPERYSYKAIESLLRHRHEVEAIGLRKEQLMGITIHKELMAFEGIDTVTLYLNPQRQEEYYSYIIGLKPRRVIFNPGTENPAFYSLLRENQIKYEVACTLVLLATGQF